MEVFGELKNAYLEKDNAGKTALGAICCGDNITSEFDHALTATPKINVGNGVEAKRIIVSDELASVKSGLQATDSDLSDRIATLEASIGGKGLVSFVDARMPSGNETFQRASRNPTMFFIDSSAATGDGVSYARSYMTLSELSVTLPIPFGVASSLLVSNISIHFDANPFLVGLSSAFNESWPAKGLSIYSDDSSAYIMLFRAEIKTVHSQHACTMSNFFGGTGAGSSGLAQIRVDTTAGGVKSFFVKSTSDTAWTSVPSTERISASVSWLKNMIWSGGSPNFNPYSFIVSSVGLFRVRAEVYILV